jgi:aryl-alcohol dehydrogenase-like predicted oxidoreductase
MRYKLLGRSGLRVSELALGTQTFGSEWGWGSDKAVSATLFDRFAESGGTFIDTANIYTDGHSERLIGEFIRHDRDHFVIATKYSGAVGAYSADSGAIEANATRRTFEGDISRSGNSRKAMFQAIDASLAALGTDHIDLFYLHFWDGTTRVDEVLRGLDDLVSAGKVLYVALSDTPAWIVSQASVLADLRGWAPVVAIQFEYSLVERTPERELLPMAHALDLGAVAWSPLGGGVLTRKYADPDSTVGARFDARSVPPGKLAIATAVGELADQLSISSAQVALAWLRQQSEQWGVVVPLIGARTLDQLTDNLASLDVILTDDQLDRLDKASSIDLGFPHTMLNSDLNRALRTSGKYHLLDNHRA